MEKLMDNNKSSINPEPQKKSKGVKYPTIQTRLTIAFSILGILVVAAVILIQFNSFRTGLRNEIRQRLVSITRIAALQQDGDLLTKVSSGEDEYYQKINSVNLKIKDSDPDLIFVYTMRKNDQGIYFVVDANRPGDEDISAFGELYQEPGPTLLENFDTINQTIIEPDFYTDEYGTFLSAYAPIYSSAHENVGVLGIDMNASKVVAKENEFLRNSLVVLLVIIPIIIILGSVFGRVFASPLARLASETRKIGGGNFEMEELTNPGTSEVAELGTAFLLMTRKINELVNTLEDRVSERTAQLEQTNKRSEYRESLLQAVAEVASAIASISDMESLFPKIAEVISDRFGHYHVGIFLLDENKEFALLKAANSPGGRRMLERKHKLQVTNQGIVGFVAGSGEPRVALDTGSDAYFFKNIDLPKTRSELALPMKIGDQIIGVLDVQSDQPNAFSEDDIKTLGALANQVAVAIQNAKLFTETIDALNEAQSVYKKFIQTGWSYFMEQSAQIGYQFINNTVHPLTKPMERTEINEVLETGQLVADTRSENRVTIPTLAVPIKVRGQTIGVLDIRSTNPTREWESSDLSTAQTIADRLAFSLDNARLVGESQKRVARERAISDMTAKIGSSVEVRTILQQTVQELGKLIGNSEVVIQIGNENNNQVKE
jgi:GAF domain-containing protein